MAAVPTCRVSAIEPVPQPPLTTDIGMSDSSTRSIVEEITHIELNRRLRFRRPLELNVTHDPSEQQWVCSAPAIGDLVTGAGDTIDKAKTEFVRDAFSAWDAGQLSDLAVEH